MEVGQGPNWGCSAKERRPSNRDVTSTLLSDDAVSNTSRRSLKRGVIRRV
jgi:hypothetical protein